MVGKAGLVVGVGIAAFAITTLILKVTGLDKKLKAGRRPAAFDLAAKLGLVKDPMAAVRGQEDADTGRRSSRCVARPQVCEATPQQTANVLAGRHPEPRPP